LSGAKGGAFKLLQPYLAGEWRALALAGVSTLAVVAAYLARPFPLAIAVDRIVGEHGGRPFELSGGDWRLLLILAGSVLVIALVNALGSHIADDRLENAAERIVHRLRVATYSRLQRMSLAFHERQHTGDLVTRVTGDVEAVGSLFSNSLGTLASAMILLGGMLTVSVIIDPLLALTAFAAAPILALVAFRFVPQARYNAHRRRAALRELAALSDESIASMRAVKALGAERFEEERLERKSEEIRDLARIANRVEGRFSGVVDTLGAVALALVIVVGVLRVASGAVSAGELIVMYTYARRIDRPLRALARGSARASRSLARADSVAELLAAEELEEDRPGAYRGPRARGEVELRDVSFAYTPARPAVTGVSLRLAPGEKVALTGPAGAGKSTVAALVARLYDPTSGQVLIDRRDARDCELSWLREQFGLVLQETILFTGSVAENIAYGLEAKRADVVEAAKAAGAHDFISQLPDGYETKLGPRGTGLSGGQGQCIAIARTLLRDPPILVLDEPTSGLDAESEAKVLRGLETLMKGRTTLLIAHSGNIAGTADRVVAMEAGGIVAERAKRASASRLTGLPAPPHDRALPAMGTLLDPEAMGEVLQRTLPEVTLERVAGRYLRYKPATSLVVRYDVAIRGRSYVATAMVAKSDLERRARKPENLALAELIDGRSPASFPMRYDRRLGALIQWFPLDVAVPALARRPAELVERLSEAGAEVEPSPAEPVLLAYKPRRRAVIGIAGHVIKLYAREHRFRAAVIGLRTASRVGSVSAPRTRAVWQDLLATAQTFERGRSVADSEDAVVAAGALIARLHAESAHGVLAAPPARQLEKAAESARQLVSVVPELAPRVDRLLAALERTRPDHLPLVASHGDFYAKQLLIAPGGELVLTDFDEICAAPPALDLATWASHVWRHSPHRPDRMERALDRLVAGYGERPEGLPWYLATMMLRRAPHPFRRFEPEWPDRIEAMVRAAELTAPV
jgi:ATP-binding cassette, subfamily B, bacterial